MNSYNKNDIAQLAAQTNFLRDNLEKVLRLSDVLQFIAHSPKLKDCLVLKGGTAINLTVFNIPRLSVDIDLDFHKDCTREEMLQYRAEINAEILAYMESQGYQLNPNTKNPHALDSWVFLYRNAGGNRDNIKIEINYSLRTHVLLPEDRVLVTDAFGEPIKVRTVAAMEIFAAKTNALISRAAARDLYDFCNMADINLFAGEEDLFRKCIIFYATISAKEVNKKFDTSAIDSLVFSKIKSDLFPVLAVKDKFDRKRQI